MPDRQLSDKFLLMFAPDARRPSRYSSNSSGHRSRTAVSYAKAPGRQTTTFISSWSWPALRTGSSNKGFGYFTSLAPRSSKASSRAASRRSWWRRETQNQVLRQGANWGQHCPRDCNLRTMRVKRGFPLILGVSMACDANAMRDECQRNTNVLGSNPRSVVLISWRIKSMFRGGRINHLSAKSPTARFLVHLRPRRDRHCADQPPCHVPTDSSAAAVVQRPMRLGGHSFQ